jgi:hypothetical protein
VARANTAVGVSPEPFLLLLLLLQTQSRVTNVTSPLVTFLVTILVHLTLVAASMEILLANLA